MMSAYAQMTKAEFERVLGVLAVSTVDGTQANAIQRALSDAFKRFDVGIKNSIRLGDRVRLDGRQFRGTATVIQVLTKNVRIKLDDADGTIVRCHPSLLTVL